MLLRSLIPPLLALAAVQASASLPEPPPPDTARLEAARAFVRVLINPESSMTELNARHPACRLLIARLFENAESLRPGMDQQTLSQRVRALIDMKVDNALHEFEPELAEDLATEFARLFDVEQLAAATAFYGAPQGRLFAFRMVLVDPVFENVVHARLFAPIAADLEQLIADAEDGERLRRHVNSQ